MANYIAEVLYALDELSKEKSEASIKEIRSRLKRNITDRQLNQSLHNFRRRQLNLIERIEFNYYKLNRVVIEDVLKRYEAGTFKLWYDSKGQDKINKGGRSAIISRKSKTGFVSNLNQARAIVMYHASISKDPMTSKQYRELGESLGISIPRKTFSNIWIQSKDQFHIGKIDGQIFYYPNEFFMEKHVPNKDYFESIIGKSIDMEAFETNEKQIELKGKYTCGDIAGAILAAYEKPLTTENIINIAASKGFDMNYKSLYAALTIGNLGYFRKGMKIGKENTFLATQKFFENVDRNILIKILPDKADKINTRYNRIIGPLPEENSPSSEISAEPADLQTAENTEQKTAPAEISAEENAQEQASNELIEAANVGASIIAYINKLKKRNQQTDPTEFEALKEKSEDQSRTILNQRNQIHSFQGQIEKLKGIVENQNENIKNLTHLLGNARMELEELKAKKMPATFNLGEVARITRVVKGT